ncbi:MAG: stage III sporulation protein AD [Bacillota bacterium]
MEIVQIVAFGLVAVAMLALLRQQRPEFAVHLALVAGVAIFLFLVPKLFLILDLLVDLGQRAGVNPVYIGSILKILGIAYIADFGGQISRDAGENAIASRIELGGKLLILLLALPIVRGILDMVARLLG